ncbi:sensor domain-containing diguanylate cyclase [Collimonas pratensis]|uniref:diguanylate cyclase n=1 Tax=Collimonas pratensis TaxID=279113 RepID=A0A127Q447_9BURK|nr:GGDEF domain-containing protein [Collimonas pratensis]AMP04781.1 diguanylate cyclase domain protein [Collimonas pratensis]AMP15174.1 diguanylate cyclase domain protein [Collimonas pratensis]
MNTTTIAIAARQVRTNLKPLPITFLATLFVVLVCVSLLAVEAWRSWNARIVELQETEIATSNLARALSEHADDTIKQADTVLIGVVEHLELDGNSGASLERLHKLLMQHIAELPQLNDLSIYDETGLWLVNARSGPIPIVNNSDRQYFRYHRDHLERGAYIGPPVRSRSTGAWIVTVSRRYNHADGSFAGLALATINIGYFKNFYDSFDIGRAGSIFLSLNDGTMLVRSPMLDNVIGKNLANYPIYRDYASKNAVGTAVMRSGQDGVERLIAYRHLVQYPLFITVARSKEEVLADWRADTYLHVLGALLLTLALGLLGWRLIHQIQLRLAAEAGLLQVQESLRTLNQHLEQLAMQDSLTGLANRRHFDSTLRDEFSRATRNANSLALVMIDVDYFKQYNDIYGHLAGDECLRQISEVVKASKNRPGDLAARYGGEELAVLLPDTNLAGAIAVAEKIRQAIYNLQIEHAFGPVGMITISAGVEAFVPLRDDNIPFELIQAADKAMYAAKAAGRNCVRSSEDLR